MFGYDTFLEYFEWRKYNFHMKEATHNILTVEKFEEVINRLDKKMMDGFEAVFERFDRVESRVDKLEIAVEKFDRKLDRLSVTKADRKDILIVDRRLTRLENKAA